MKCIITIELGTNAVRVFAYDLGGNIIGSQKGYYPTFHHGGPDYSEQDPDQIFITMLYVLKNLLNERVHARHYKVASICFSASMHSVVAVDKNGTALGNAITWSDNRAKKEAQELKASAQAKNIYTKTGTPIHPMSPLLKITWFKKQDKTRFKETSKFLSIKSYVIRQLTGECLMDYSMASATGLMNIHKIQWEPEALRYAGITAGHLPDPVPVFASAGKLKKAYQQSLGLPADTKVVIGSSDGCMAILGDGIQGEGKATITIEDSGAVRVIGPKVLQDSKQRFFNYLLTENVYVSGGPTNNGGVVFEWFAKQFGENRHFFDTDHTIDDLIAEASKITPGAEGLLFLPYLLGERAPIWNANARGLFFGMNINHEKKHFIRAVMEGILYEIRSIGKTLEEHRTIKSLSVNGSFGSIPLCTQILADMFNKPVHLRPHYQSVSYGAFLVAATEMGIYTSLEEAAKTVELTETYTPHKPHHSIYEKYSRLFDKLSTKLSDEFEIIAGLQ